GLTEFTLEVHRASACSSRQADCKRLCTPSQARDSQYLRRRAMTDSKQYRLWLVAIFLLASLLAVPTARAHEARPAYLEIKETSPNQFSVLWRTPVLAGMRLPVDVTMPGEVKNLKEPVVQELS